MPATTGSIRHLSLDVWLTLIRSNKAFKPARNRLFIAHFDLPQAEEEVLRVFREHDRLFNAINEKTGRNLSRQEMLYMILAALGKDMAGIGTDQIEAFYAEADALFFQHPPQLPDTRIAAVLTDVRRCGITISLLSNTAFITGATLRRLWPVLGLEGIFDFQLYSDELERSKPAPEVYNMLSNRVARLQPVAKSEVLHIGDNVVADYHGAIDAGFQAVLFNPENETLSDLVTSLLLCTPPLPCIK